MTSVPVLVAGLGLLRQVAVSCRRLLIGSAPEWSYRDGQLMRDNAMRGDLALEPGKPSHLFARTGRLPKFAAGNGGAAIRPQYSPIRGDTPDLGPSRALGNRAVATRPDPLRNRHYAHGEWLDNARRVSPRR